MTSRVFSCSILLVAQVYIQYWANPRSKKHKWTDQHLYFGIGGTTLWLLGNLWNLLMSEDYSTYPQFNIRLNTHLRLDAWIHFCCSLIFFAFPNVVITLLDPVKAGLDPIAMHLVRVTGVQCLGAAFTSLLAPGFLHENDKKMVLLTRLLMYIPFALVTALAQFQYNIINRQLLITGCLLDGPVIINALLALLTDVTTIYKVKAK